MAAYQSQFFVGRDQPGEVLELVNEICAYFGNRIGVAAAEPFHTDEPIALPSLDGLL
jgi:hypothetical protein